MADQNRLLMLLTVTATVLMTASSFVFNKRDNLGVPLFTFKLKKIAQQPADNGFNVQLHFEGSRFPRVFMVDGDLSSPAPVVEVEVDSNGVAEFFSSKNRQRVLLLHPRGHQGLSLSLQENSLNEQIIPDLELYVDQGGELIFQNNTDLEVNARFRVEQTNTAGINTELSANSGITVKSTSIENAMVHYYVGADSPLQILEHGKSISERWAHLRILTSSGEVEGLLEFDVEVFFRDSENNLLLHQYTMHEDVLVYQANRNSPFPDNFIGILIHGDENINVSRVCGVRRPYYCSITCEFIGDEPSPVEFARVTDGETSPMSALSLSNNGYRALGHLSLSNLSMDDAGLYQCKSTSGSKQAVGNMTLFVVLEAQIFRNLSTFTMLNGTTEAVCVAEGNPAPIFDFSINHADFGDYSNGHQFEVMQTDALTWRAVLRVTDPSVASGLTYVECRARNGMHDQFFYDHAVLLGFEPFSGYAAHAY